MSIVVTMTLILGIDPGWKGALAFLNPVSRALTTIPMPVEKRKNGKTYLDCSGVLQALKVVGPITEAWIEDVYSSPQMGVVSAFSFGEGKGTLVGILAARGVPTRFVSPSTWKARLNLTSDKNHTKAFARALFPHAGKHLSTEGKCEAALIAQYGALTVHSTRA